MTLFKNKYRIKSTRLKGWNYAAAGLYFVTICTGKRECCFGEVAKNQMRLTPIGETAAMFWRDIPRHFARVIVDEFVIMPNHVHGILVINAPETTSASVETRHVASLPTEPAAFGPLKPGSLSKIIQAYKAAVTHWCRENGHAGFAWQPRFYDHIIRDEAGLEHIRQYIANNPAKWALDRNRGQEVWL